MPEPVAVALEVLALMWAIICAFVAVIGILVWMSSLGGSRRPTHDQWDLAMANALDMASALELEISPDPREMVLGCLRREMGKAELAPEVRAAFVTAALSVIDQRRQAWGMRPLEYAVTGYDHVPPGARVYRGHPDGMSAETLYEEQLRLQQADDYEQLKPDE